MEKGRIFGFVFGGSELPGKTQFSNVMEIHYAPSGLQMQAVWKSPLSHNKFTNIIHY